jgi:hypothetical protein
VPNPRRIRRCPRGDDDCESLLLGSLLRSVKAQGLWPIDSSPPHFFMDTTTLIRKLRGLKVQSQCAKLTARPETHGVAEDITEIVTTLQGSHKGLKLKDLQGDSLAK